MRLVCKHATHAPLRNLSGIVAVVVRDLPGDQLGGMLGDSLTHPPCRSYSLGMSTLVARSYPYAYYYATRAPGGGGRRMRA